jgi:hypothetical protein
MAVMLIGHGGWEVRGTPAYAQVPRGSSITFYTENFKLLYVSNAAEIVSMSQMFSDAEPNDTVGEYRTCPNYSLYRLEEPIRSTLVGLTADMGTPLFVGDDVSDGVQLCTDADGTTCESGIHRCEGIFAHPAVQGQEIYWIACRHVDLAEVGGGAVGVNQAQTDLGADSGWDQSAWESDFFARDDDGRRAYWQELAQEYRDAATPRMREWAQQEGLL